MAGDLTEDPVTTALANAAGMAEHMRSGKVKKEAVELLQRDKREKDDEALLQGTALPVEPEAEADVSDVMVKADVKVSSPGSESETAKVPDESATGEATDKTNAVEP